jgi:hypothetical protein
MGSVFCGDVDLGLANLDRVLALRRLLPGDHGVAHGSPVGAVGDFDLSRGVDHRRDCVAVLVDCCEVLLPKRCKPRGQVVGLGEEVGSLMLRYLRLALSRCSPSYRSLLT